MLAEDREIFLLYIKMCRQLIRTLRIKGLEDKIIEVELEYKNLVEKLNKKIKETERQKQLQNYEYSYSLFIER